MLNLPNLLTLARLAITPLAVWAILKGEFRLALALLLVAGLTDALDGVVARRFDCRTRTGAYLDPFADKVLLCACYLALGAAGVAPWWLVGLIFGRDLVIVAMAGGALLFTPYRHFKPSVWGKISTGAQVIAAVGLMAARAFPALPLADRAVILIWLAAAATTWSGMDYVRQGVVRLRALR